MDRKRFFAQKPLNVVEYTSLEFYHPVTGVERFVTGQREPLQFTLESGAPRGAGLQVQFDPVAFLAKQPKMADSGVSLEIQLGIIGQMLKEKVKLMSADDMLTPYEVIWRKHQSDEVEPTIFFYFEVDTLSLKDLAGVIRAREVNGASRNVSNLYNTIQHPGLRLSR